MERFAERVGLIVKTASPWCALPAMFAVFGPVEAATRALLPFASALGLSGSDGALLSAFAMVLAGFALAAGLITGSAYHRYAVSDAMTSAVALVVIALAGCLVFGGSAAWDVVGVHDAVHPGSGDGDRSRRLHGTLTTVAILAYSASFVATSNALMIRQAYSRWRDRVAAAVLTLLIAMVLAPMLLLVPSTGAA